MVWQSLASRAVVTSLCHWRLYVYLATARLCCLCGPFAPSFLVTDFLLAPFQLVLCHLAQNSTEEPYTRRGEQPMAMRATVTAGPGLLAGKQYELCRFEGTETLPT